MGSVGKGSVYSDVDNKYTPMSREAEDIVAHGSTRYFNSSDSFYINQALRMANDENISLDDALERIKSDAWWDDRDVAMAKAVIKTMDENMQPIDKEMRVLRMADINFLTRILERAKVPSDLKDSILFNMARDRGVSQDDLNALSSYMVGGKIYENAFMSTSHNLGLTDSAFRHRDVIIDARVGAGTKGMFSPTRRESEFVIDRHEGYVVKGFTVEGNKLRILVDVN